MAEKKVLELFCSTELWVGGVIGAILGVIGTLVVTLLTNLPKLIRQRLPIGRLMESLLDNEQACLMVAKVLTHPTVDAKNPLGTVVYLSEIPNAVGAGRATSLHPNIPEVIAKADTYAMTTVAQFLGEQGKTEMIEFVSAVHADPIWDKNIICIGGSVKSQAILRGVEERLVKLELNKPFLGAFIFPDSKQHFLGLYTRNPLRGFDYGIILKTTYTATGKKCLVVMGNGVFGTEAAAYFLKNNAHMLGTVYGKNDFVVMVKTIIEEGPQSAKLWWFYPEPDWKWRGKKLYRPLWQDAKSQRT